MWHSEPQYPDPKLFGIAGSWSGSGSSKNTDWTQEFYKIINPKWVTLWKSWSDDKSLLWPGENVRYVKYKKPLNKKRTEKDFITNNLANFLLFSNRMIAMAPPYHRGVSFFHFPFKTHQISTAFSISILRWQGYFTNHYARSRSSILNTYNWYIYNKHKVKLFPFFS